MTSNKPMTEIRAEVGFNLTDIIPGELTLPQEVIDALGDVRKDFRSVEYGGFHIVGRHISGCADQAGCEEYFVVIENLANGIPCWLREIDDYTVRINDTNGFKLPVSISVRRCSGNNKVDIVSKGNWGLALEAYKALAGLTELTYCMGCGRASSDPWKEGVFEPGHVWYDYACHRLLFDTRY